jgi:isoleucyl-tRNA synthetase
MDYRKTLNLPQTSFPMKARLVEREPAMLDRWRRMGAYARLRERRRGAETYILHDGPPYSNGHIHLGHALNKVAKDLIVRSRTMMGYDAPYLPGWDNHGMPIEMNILKEMKKEKREIDPMTLRANCREYARRYVEIQREEFIRLGIWGEWETPYLTMDPRYEEAVLRTFGEMVEQGFIYRGKRPIHWCPVCETALAESEIEYREKESVSITLRFPLRADPGGVFPPDHDGFVLVWTTTPWTIPANLAVVVHPEIDYVVVTAAGAACLLAERLAPVIMETIGIEDWTVWKKMKGSELAGLVFTHPLVDRESPLFMADHVNLEEGTGVVHTAPGHGMEDFLVGRREGLEILCPVDERGVFTAEAGKYEGKRVDEANGEVVEDLEEAGTLLHRETIRHQYPHCWRCKNALIYRATTQWFFSIDHKGLRERAIEAIEAVEWLPPASRNRILGMMKNRPDWCLSRQREWGVGIPILTCEDCGRPLLEKRVVDRVAERVGEEGSDCWFTLDAKSFLPEGTTCPECGGDRFRKETDILDVWFESGSSHIAVLEAQEHLRSPADIYLEGSDQHRGWFNTSLIVGLAARGEAPYRRVLTNGWTLDAEGKAMHKLEGNVVSPLEIIEKRGADVLRLWVSSNDLKSDIRISEDTLDQVSETYRRIRNTCRFLLGNLHGFEAARDGVPPESLLEVDAYALHHLETFKRKVIAAYDDMEFHTAYHAINTFCTTISAWYLDGLKDRLYTFAPRAPERRSAQTVLHEIVQVLVRVIAPILPFTSEEVWDHLGGGEGDSIHFQEFPPLRDDFLRPGLAERWDRLLRLRGDVQKGLELARTNGVIGSSQEASVGLLPEGEEWRELIESSLEALPAFFIVSEVRVESDAEAEPWLESADLPLRVSVRRADGSKCVRCWNYTTDVGASAEHPGLCGRCVTMVSEGKD